MRHIVLLSLLLSVSPAFAQTDVLTQRNDNLRTGQNINETTLTPSNVRAATFGKLFAFSVDGQVYAQPLYKSNVLIPGQGIHNVLYVATEHDSVYAFDADGQSTTPLWQVSFINPAANITPAPNADVGATDIQPEIGITGTPVIEPTTGTLYVVARTKESGTHFQRLHALDIATGVEKFGGPVVIQASVPGNGTPSDGHGNLVFDPLRHLQRPSLVLANNTVYIGYASHGDVTPYHGWVMAYNATTLQQIAAYSTTPNGAQGGVWMSGTGLAADPSGNIYFSVGNGDFDGLTNFGDSCVKLSTTTGLSTSDYFAPFNQGALSSADLDVSSGGVTLLPDAAGSVLHPHLLVVSGKDGTIYVLDRDNLGQFNSSTTNPDSQIVQEIWNALGGTPIDVTQSSLPYVNNNFSTAAYWQNNLYWGGASDHVKMFTLSNGLLATTPASQSPTTYAGNRGASPAVSANGATNGIVWAIENGTNGSSTTNATLHAYDATNLANELYNSSQAAGSRDVPDGWVKFAVPTITNGKVYVGTKTQLAVYGLLGTTQPQAATPTFSPSAGSYSTAQSVTISDATAGAAIYYTTDGSTPTTSSTLYTGPITVNVPTMTINAIATASGFLTSLTGTATYTITQASTATPTFNPAGGVYNTAQSVTISDATSGAAIYYTTNGSTPTTASTLYTGPIAANTAMTTIKAMAVASGLLNSTVATAAYILRPALPTFSPPGGTYGTIQNVTISDTIPGVAIYYTIDGSAPTTASTRYTAPITVNVSTMTINAIATSGGLLSSAVATANYTITQPSTATPTFSPPGGTYTTAQSVAILDTTPGAVIYYTTDGSAPTTASTPYTVPITVNTATMTIKAMAVASGLLNSMPATASYILQPAVPTFSPPGGTYSTVQSVTISDVTPGVVIYYTTDGSTPSTTSTRYTASITVNSATMTIKAFATSGSLTSTVATANYTINMPSTATPTFNPPAGVYTTPQSVAISDATSGAVIYYTTDGSTPSTTSTRYTAPIPVSTATTTIKAMAAASGLLNSTLATANYLLQPVPPTFNPVGGTYNKVQSVTISDATLGAVIYYTTDGTTPTVASTLYSGPIAVNTTMTINAIGVAGGVVNSAVATAVYVIQAAPPTFSPGPGTYGPGQTVTISDITPGALIYYTTDGSTPTTASTLYTAPIAVSTTTTIKAMATASAFLNSAVAAGTYTIQSGGASYGAGFATSTGLTLNGSAKITSSRLRLTDGAGNEASSAFFNTLVNVQGFTTDFSFLITPAQSSTADGFTFAIQGNSPTALGAPGGSLGYGLNSTVPGIPNSVAIKFDLYNNSGEGVNSTGLYTNGAMPSIPATNLTPSGVNLHSGHTFNVHMTYNGTTLVMSITDATNPANTFTTSFTVNIPGTVGAPTAYVGFSGGTGGLTATQDILAWSYVPGQPSAATPTFSPVAGTYTAAQSVAISDATPAALIYYTLDGSTPNTAATLYSGPIPVSATTTINAIAAASGFLNSAVGTAAYTIQSPAATPTFNPAGGTYGSAQSVTISDTTPGALIYYTFDGITPTTASTLYSGPIPVSTTTTINAIAAASGFLNSGVATTTYSILPPAATPTFSPAAGTYTSAQSVTISDSTPSAVIYYTTDGSTPTLSSTLYTVPITVSSTTTFKAVAVSNGTSISAVATITYTFPPPAATPTFSPSTGTYNKVQSVTISDTTPGATIYYTIAVGVVGGDPTASGSVPTTSSTRYTGPISVTTTETIYAIAAANGFSNSAIGLGAYTLQVATPTLSPAGGSYSGSQSVTISDTPPGAQIYYTTDGSTPTTASTLYSGSIPVNTTTTISAVAVASGFLNSQLVTATYTITVPSAATPTFSPLAGTYNGAQSVTISDTTPGAQIYYTFDGITPTTSSTLYTGPIPVSATTTINAIAAASGYLNSAVATATYTLQVATPTLSPLAGTYNGAQSVTISDTTPGAKIYYTTDGSTPTTASTLYSTAIPVNATTTINAIAALTGYSNSTVATAAYTLQVVPPTISPLAGTYNGAQSVTISDTTPGAKIYYTTDGSTPTTASTLYSAAIPVNATTTINAIAALTGYSNSTVATAAYTLQVATPTFSPPAGTYNTVQSVMISDTTPGAKVYYTTDGSAPTTSSTLYTGPITLNTSTTTTINAIAVLIGYSNSLVAAAAYTLNLPPAATPTFSPPAGTYTTVQSVIISDTTPGALIYYTTNGTVPTTSSTLYTGPIALNVSATTTFNAIAVAAGFSNSAVGTATFTINLPVTAAPTFSPTPGLYLTAQSVTISSTTAGASIFYTTNGSTPTTSSTLYVGPIPVSSSTTINAIAVASGFTNSGVATGTYTIQPPISFGSGFTSAGLTLNGPAKISSSRLRITDGGSGEASSAFYNTQMNVQAFTNDFSFLLTNPNADGFTFTIQGNSPTVVGGPGGGLGYGPDPTVPNGPKINKSVAIKFDLYNNAGEGTNSTGMFTNGAIPTTPAIDLTPSGVSLHSGHTFNVHMTYNGTTLVLQVTDATNSAKTFSNSFPVNIPGAVGGPTAYVGFTGGTGGLTATQDILSWTYVPGQPIVGTPTILPIGGTYNAVQSATISDPTPGAQIYYTTDGSTPTTSSTLYTGPISVNTSMTLNAVGAISGFLNSGVATATYSLQVATPTLSLAGGNYSTVQTLTISDSSAGAKIYYTTDGSTPTTSSTLYAGPISVNTSMTLNAIGALNGFLNSAVATATYTLQVATPTLSLAGGNYSTVQTLTISDATPGAKIYYTTDGSTPTTASTLYTGPISVNTSMTLNAIGALSGFSNSAVATATYTLQVAKPTLSLAGGNYATVQTLTISDATPGAQIYYTTDGSTPTTASTLYAGPISVNTSMTLNAIGALSGFSNSAAATASYTLQAATPTFSPAGGTYNNAQSVTLSDATPGAKIYYTTDGTTPTTASTLYAGSIAVNTTITIKAIGAFSGFLNSGVATVTYAIQAATPTFSPAAGSYNTAQSVTISDTTPGALIYYTTNGSTPTTSSTLYAGPITVNTNTTINAIAAASGFANSAVATATYNVQAPTPTFSPAAGTYTTVQSVTISDATLGALIYYTTNGSTPTTSSTLYTAPIAVNTTTTIKAIAAVSGLANSPVATATYTLNLPLAATPTFSPQAGTYNTSASMSVTLSDTTAGAAIYYSTDGTTPTTASILYTAPIPVSTTTTIKAIAVASGFANSAVATGTYTIQPPLSGPPSFGGGFTSLGMNLNGPATITTSRLRLTDGGSMEASSAFYNLAANVQAFTNDFSFQLTNPNADGFTFTIQGNSPFAVGGPGGGLGYGPDPVPPPSGPNPSIGKSVAVKFDLYNNSGEGINSTGLFTNGATPTLPAIDLTPSGIDLHSGRIFNVHMTYNGTALVMTVTDTTTASTFSTSFTVDIPTTVGGPTAYLGFTGGTGGLTAIQDILTWAYVPGQPTAATPTFSPLAGTYTAAQSVTISDIVPGVSIYYTTDGTTPTTASTLYTGPIAVNATTTINAIAVASGYSNSAVATATYTLNLPAAAAPTFSPVAGTYVGAQSVTISDSTPGAQIYYTTDGTTPTTASTLYTGPITLTATTTINAIAVASGFSNSVVATAAYTIQ